MRGKGTTIFAIDVGLEFGATPVAMLVTVVALSGGVALLMAGASGGLARLVDRRWPAAEPMSPAELLWGEVGGHVQKTFPGLDPDVATDLTPYLSQVSIPAGEPIAEEGAPAAQFYVITKGVAAGDGGTGPPLGPGDGVGADAILGSGAHHETVVAIQDCKLLALSAADYVAAVTLGARLEGDADPAVSVAERMAAEGDARPLPAAPEAPAAPVPGTPPPQPAPDPGPPAVEGAGPRESGAVSETGPDRAVVMWTELPGFVVPGADTPTHVLDAGMVVTVIERLAEWAHVRAGSGWQGWVQAAGLEATGEGDT